MPILIFYVIIFGIFTMTITQYIEQYRKAYKMWIFLIAYNGHKNLDSKEKKNYCSEIESYSREICELTDMLHLIVILVLLIATFVIRVGVKNLPLVDEATINITYGTILLTIILIITVIPVFFYAKLNIIDKKRTSLLDEKIFFMWYNTRCHECKEKKSHAKHKPDVLYEIFLEKINNGEIQPTKEEIEFMNEYKQLKDVGKMKKIVNFLKQLCSIRI